MGLSTQRKIQSILNQIHQLPLGSVLQIHSDFWLILDLDGWREMTLKEQEEYD